MAFIFFVCTTFAWFTSKDEVTNRLTANADYGVSIVESFVPPKNMLPGQEVNKDVYAVNTGTIGAFVKETVSGRLTYTYEKRVTDAPEFEAEGTDNGYVRLDTQAARVIDGATTHEAGGFLAWTDAKTAVNKTYQLDGIDVVLGTAGGDIVAEENTVGGKTYHYKYVDGDSTYYGENLEPNTKFGLVGWLGVSTTNTKTLTVITTGGDAAVTPGPVGSATITDTTESTGENPIDNPGQVAERWHPTETGTYIFRRSYNPAVADVTGTKYYFDTEDVTATLEKLDTPVTATQSPGFPVQKTFNYKCGDYYAVTNDPNETFYKVTTSAGIGGTTNYSYSSSDTKTLTVDNAAVVTPGDTEHYTYAGYYYVADPDPAKEGQYYKIVIGNDPFRAANESVNQTTGIRDMEFDISADSRVLGNGATAGKDGVIEGDPLIQYVKDVTVTNVTPTLTYYETDSDANPTTAYLKATYTDSLNGGAASADYTLKQQAMEEANQAVIDAKKAVLAAQSNAAAREVDYENALGAYNTAKSRYDQTYADWAYADALVKATQALIDAADDRATVEKAKDDAFDAMKAALQAIKTEVTTLTTSGGGNGTAPGTDTDKFGDIFNDSVGLRNDDADISYKTFFQTGTPTLETRIRDTANAAVNGNAANSQLLKQADEWLTQLSNQWGTIKDKASALSTAVTNFNNLDYTANRDDAALAEQYRTDLYKACKELKEELDYYKSLYNTLTTTDYAEAALTGLLSADATANLAKIQAWIDRVAALESNIAAGKDDADIGTADFDPSDKGMDALVSDYAAKYRAYDEQLNVEIPKAEKDWEDAFDKYNTDVRKAQDDYYDRICTEQMSNDEAGNLSKNSFELLQTPTDLNITRNNGTAISKTAGSDKKWLKDESITLVGQYSAERVATGDPTLEKDDGGNWKNLWKTIEKDGTDPATTEAKYIKTGDSLGTTPPSTADSNSYTKATLTYNYTEETFPQVEKSPTSAAANQQLSALKSDMEGKKSTWETELGKYKAAKKAITDAEANKDAKDDALLAATQAAGNAAKADDSAISFTIYLDDKNTASDYELAWTSALANGESSDKAEFYYNYILNPGETSDKLIDAVKLDETVTSKDYKSLVFDLDVGLDSVQVTYKNDQRTLSADAVTEETFGKTVANADSLVADENGKVKVEWGQADALAGKTTVYKVGLTVINAPADLAANAPAKGDYKYSITVGSDTYYGTSKENGAEYFKFVPGDSNAVPATTDHVDTTIKAVLTVTEK